MDTTLDLFFPLFESESNEDFWRIEEIRKYHESLMVELERIYRIAETARKKGLDPEPKVEIPIAKNMAERVEKLMGLPGLAECIMQLEGEGLSREIICFKVADEILEGRFGEFSKEGAIDKAVRTAVAIMTEGVVAAPIEGIAKVKIDRDDFLRVYYAGPIRSAGGNCSGYICSHCRLCEEKGRNWQIRANRRGNSQVL